MSSGSYFPPPVRRVDIPKGDAGGTRPLGIPTVADRIAQMVVKRYLEPILEPVFHADSYGYRPGKSAHDALAKARQRCWRVRLGARPRHQGFFDEIDWDLLMRARAATHGLPMGAALSGTMAEGAGEHAGRDAWSSRERGTPQGAVVSPVLANLFLHYAFDLWMRTEVSRPFRSNDMPTTRSAIADSEAQALELRQALEQRFAACGLTLHPEKTKIVYCKDANRPGTVPGTVIRLSRLHVPAESGD